MSHRIFRISISPDAAPEVRRVIDFDGRSSLHDVHELMLESLNIGDDDHLYAFFLSGKFWDKSSEYCDPRTEGRRADQALLFRLQLRAGQHFVYVYDYGAEHRYSLTVVSVTEARAALPAPLLIESVGEAPVGEFDFDESDGEDETDGEDDDETDETDEDDSALEQSLQLAAGIVERFDALDALGEGADTEQLRSLLRPLGEATLAFLLVLGGDWGRLTAVDLESDFELVASLLELPARLREADETALAVRVAEALKFAAPDEMNGEIALSHVKAGDRERALSALLTGLESAEEPFIAELKAGDVYRELGEADAAEAYYRRALAIAELPSDRREAAVRIAGLMIDTGREADAAAFLSQQSAAASAPAGSSPARVPAVGRNEPCPCGSGKKYKKCHGT